MTQEELILQQDQLRTQRQFISVIGQWLGADQSFADQDGVAYNPTGQFSVVGPYGTSVEGRPITTTRNGGLVISPAVVLIGLGVAATLLLKKG